MEKVMLPFVITLIGREIGKVHKYRVTRALQDRGDWNITLIAMSNNKLLFVNSETFVCKFLKLWRNSALQYKISV